MLGGIKFVDHRSPVMKSLHHTPNHPTRRRDNEKQPTKGTHEAGKPNGWRSGRQSIAMTVVRGREDTSLPNEKPPSPFSYSFPLLLVVLACVGFLWYRRKERHELSVFLRDIAARSRIAKRMGGGGAVRLSTDGLPSSHEFLSNNASTDSLPNGVELPHMSNTSPITAQALSKVQKPPVALSEKSKIVPASLPRRFLRRSRRQEGPVEPDDEDDGGDDSSDSSADELEAAPVARAPQKLQEPLFGIGDEEPDSPTTPSASAQSPRKGRR